VGKLIDSKKTIEKSPSLKNGIEAKLEDLIFYKNLYILNGVGGRGFVFAPFLAKQLIDSIFKDTKIEKTVESYRLFKKWVKRN
jgi:hypothetical protein